MKVLLEILLTMVIIIFVIIGSIVFALLIAEKIFYFKRKNNKFIKLEDKKLLEDFIDKDYMNIISNNRENYNITDDDYWYFEETVEDIDSLCRNLLEGNKKIYITKEEVLDKDFQNFIKTLNNDKIMNIFNELKQIKKIIFKYYDNDGNLKNS